jgi:pyoverdine/dityrosine biosynthesis protein Dit1
LLVDGYAEPEETIKHRLMQDEQGLQLYRAITRFLYEDSQLPGYSGSNAALQKDAKQRACGVIQRSWAWGNLLAQHFPLAIRLSIHPQPADSLKMGIHMMPTKDDWLTVCADEAQRRAATGGRTGGDPRNTQPLPGRTAPDGVMQHLAPATFTGVF